MEGVNRPPPVRGWLLVLCILLLVWQPVSLGFVAASALGSLALRGASAALILGARILVAAFGVAAGLAILGRRPGGIALARLSLVASAAMDAFVYLTPYSPYNRAPGETPLLVALSTLYYAVWLTYLSRSKDARDL